MGFWLVLKGVSPPRVSLGVAHRFSALFFGSDGSPEAFYALNPLETIRVFTFFSGRSGAWSCRGEPSFCPAFCDYALGCRGNWCLLALVAVAARAILRSGPYAGMDRALASFLMNNISETPLIRKPPGTMALNLLFLWWFHCWPYSSPDG